MKSGYVSPQTNECMQPIDVPKIEPQMIHFQSVGEQRVMQRDHVVIVVIGKMRVHPVARLRRFSVPDAIHKDQVIARCVEHLPRIE